MADPAVSGRHCLLLVDGAQLRVRDNESRNGTFVGPARVLEALAGPGTAFVVGRSTVVLHRGEAPGLAEAELGEPLPGLVGGSLGMRRVAADVRRFADLALPVLVSGESGTGKELVAHALHQLSPRRERPFIAYNVAAMPAGLVESEMFGHERGAFTGAVGRKAGLFEQAEGGTLFLDEIGELPLDAQPKLLRALDGYTVRSVGATGAGRTFATRFVAATHVQLLDRVGQGQFRLDLFHRLAVLRVEIPPLRERRGDIPLLARALLRSLRHEVGVEDLTSHAAARLMAYPWPGNVRELKNVLLRAAVEARGKSLVEASHIELALFGSTAHKRAATLTPAAALALLRSHGGNVSAAARAAERPRTSFRKLVAQAAGGAEWLARSAAEAALAADHEEGDELG